VIWKALTLTQPWCGLVASGIKTVENRPRAMIRREDFHKPFALHASRENSKEEMRRIIECAPDICADLTLPWFRLAAITSAIIGVATIREALYIGGNSPETTRAMLEKIGILDQERFVFGPTVYVLDDIRALSEPIPCRGWQAFWTVPNETAVKIEDQLARAA